MNDENELPALTYSFLDYFSSYQLYDKILLEIGSGSSTLYWEKKFKKVITYENNILFFNDIKEKVKKHSTEVFFYNDDIFGNEKFVENIKLADYIIIDNDPRFITRMQFSTFIHQNMREDSTIILDNGMWNLDAYSYLIENFFVKDFPGLNKLGDLTVTSIFNPIRKKEYDFPL